MRKWKNGAVPALSLAFLFLLGCSGGGGSDDPVAVDGPADPTGGGDAAPAPGSVEAVLQKERLYAFTADSVSGPRYFRYQAVAPDPEGGPVESEYEYDFDDAEPALVWLPVTATATGYYLGPQGWVQGSGRMHDFTFAYNPDGGATLAHKGAGARLNLSIATSSLAGQSQGTYLGDDGFLLDKGAVFPAGAEEFRFDAKALDDLYLVEKWEDPMMPGFDYNSVQPATIPDPSDPLGFTLITMDTLASIPVVYGYESGNYLGNIARWSPYRLELQFGPDTGGGGSVHLFRVIDDWLVGTTYNELPEQGVWSIVTVSGAQLLRIEIPPSLAGTYNIPGIPFIAPFTMEGTSGFKYGTLYPAGSPVPMGTWMNQIAYDSLMGNLDPAALTVN